MSRYMVVRLMSPFTLPALAAAALVLAAIAPRAGAQDDEHDRNHGKHAHSMDADETTTIDTTIAFAATGGVADLSLISGKITVTAWARPEARVHVTSDHVPVRFEHESGRLLLDARGYRHRHDDDDDGDNDVEFTITVPAGTRVILHSISGDLEVQGTRGEIEAHSVSGDIRVDDVAHNATLESLSGNMTVHNVRGDLHMRTVSGDAEADMVTGDVTFTSVSGHGYVTRATSRSLHMESVSGDLTYGGTLDPSGSYDLHAHSGDVHIDLPADASATVSLDSFSGEITSDFPITIQPRGETGPAAQHLDATLGKGGARITVVTFSGDIELRSGTPHKR